MNVLGLPSACIDCANPFNIVSRPCFSTAMHDGVDRLQCMQIGFRRTELADHRRGAFRGKTFGFFRVARQRGDLMTALDHRVEGRRPDVTGSSGQEHVHGVLILADFGLRISDLRIDTK